jgi:hypothetical protein
LATVATKKKSLKEETKKLEAEKKTLEKRKNRKELIEKFASG